MVHRANPVADLQCIRMFQRALQPLLRRRDGGQPVIMARTQRRQRCRQCTASAVGMACRHARCGETLRQLCLAGNGITCLSDYMMQKDIDNGDLVPLFVPQVMRIAMPIHAVYYSDQAVSTRIRCFIDFLGEKMAQPASSE